MAKKERQKFLQQRVLDFIQENKLVSSQHCLLVAVSGGPDSVCLLHILVKLREELGISLYVAHLNHQLRGAESEADAQYVSDLAHRLDIPASIEQRDVKAFKAQQHISLEEAAREVRYTFLAQVAKSIGANRVAVGHTADDHIETILMHLIRGTGTRGLRGLQPFSRWQPSGGSLTIVRPDKETTREWGKIVQKQGNTITLDKEGFFKLPSALKRYLFRRAIEDLLGNLKDIETRHIEEIMDALTKPAGKRLSLPGGLIFSIEYNRYLISSEPAALSPFPILGAEFPLKLPGETVLAGWRIEATIISREQMTEKDEDFTAYFDRDKTSDKLLARPRQPGDRFQPLGMSQPKKLGQFMIDAKIPSAWRQRIPLVCSPQHILWVVGWRIDERVKVTEKTKQVLRLKFKRG